MPVMVLPRSPLGRSGTAAAAAVGIVGALSVATFSNSWLAQTVSDGVSDRIASVKTVAAMLAERSPGERPEGALANLKPKRQAVLHERALPKVRPPSPAYQALVGPPPPTPPIVALPQAPVYNSLAGAPVVPVTGGMGGGPPLLADIPPPSTGGGIFTPPVAQETPGSPPVPVTPTTPTSPVPEPATWAMMILGFVLMGKSLGRRRNGAAVHAAR